MAATGVCRRVVAIAAASTAVVLSVIASPVVTADTAIVVGGFGTPTPGQWYLDHVLAGTVSGPGWTRIGITYPATGGPLLSGPGTATVGQSVSQGAETTYQTIIDTDDNMIVTGTSEGSAVVDAAQARLVNDPKAPAPNRITFVYTAPLQHHDPKLATSFLWYLQGIHIPIVDFTPRPPVQDSQYNTVVLAGEYDWAADFPDRPWNLLADLNSFMAGLYPSAMSIHGATTFADPDPAKYPAENVRTVTNTKGATITTIVVPTHKLPLLDPWREMGIAAPLVDAAEALVRPIVDAGYSRNDARHPLIPHLPPVTRPILGDNAAPLPKENGTHSALADDADDITKAAAQDRDLPASSTATAARQVSATSVTSKAQEAEHPGEDSTSAADTGGSDTTQATAQSADHDEQSTAPPD